MLLWFATSMPPSPDQSSESDGPDSAVDLDRIDGLAAVQRLLAPIVDAFTSASFRLYLVGGVVRDLLNGDYHPGSDLDLTTDAEPADIKRLVKPLAKAVWTQGERFGTIGVQITDDTAASGVREVEITTHRAEQYSPESSKPKVAFGSDLREDLSRRDFTVNAMAIELLGELSDGSGPAVLRDPFDGHGDLERRVLRTPLGPVISFDDDPLRMMRAARFMARLDLEPVLELETAATGMADRLAIVSVERIADELERLLAVAEPAPGLEFLQRTGLLSQIIGVGFAPGFTEADAVSLAAKSAPVAVRRAGLLLPVAEPSEVLARLRYSNADRASTAGLIEALKLWAAGDHDAGEGLPLARRSVDAATRSGSTVDDLSQLATNVGGRYRTLVSAVDRLKANNDVGPYVSPLSGPEIISLLQTEPGPIIGQVQRFLREKRLQLGPLDHETAHRLVLNGGPDFQP